ncbi:MAG: metallophosphoesterase, partial [Candidatus Sumerlaeota bacterium]|nr:metallophosphoesterase [Candidatus Sumerlaeota bacterium]
MVNRVSLMCKAGVVAAMVCGLLAASVFAAPAPKDKEEKINMPTGPLVPTTEQLIDADTLASHPTGTLLVLHTNDIHDIIKPQADNPLGGMAYISGYVHQMRQKRPDTLMLDAGDLMQKGDTLGPASKGEAPYRALGAIGCDCTVPGNHDFAYGVDAFRNNIQLAGLNAICAGMVYEKTQKPLFPETLEKQVGSLKIGMIGGTANTSTPSDKNGKIIKFAQPELGKRVNELAQEMEPRVDLTIMILHNGTQAGLAIAKAAPAVDVVVCGHTNEVTEKPLKAESGALIVEVGRAGLWVGSLDMVVDRDEKKIGKYTYEMIPTDHKKIQPDEQLAQQIDEWEKKWCPEVQAPIAEAPKALSGSAEGGMGDAGRWLGRAILAKMNADVVLFHREFFRK